MQAIQTRYLGPTNSRGARIKAWAAAGSITIDYPYELSGQACHRAAAEALALKRQWDTPFYGQLLGGQLANGDYAFVWNNAHSKGFTMRQHYTTTRAPSRLAAAALAIAIGLALATVLFVYL